ncbi:MAG: hypothetical protein CMA07_04740 [Euryarchaeota archaeon]|nr:hypothetical protein [Euryarchaeota archaeon]|tara:strand:- start:1594 stop:2655 length:1062 start_codon:yes stop_codon:yes gene_type:complete
MANGVGIVERTQSLKRESLADLLTVVDRHATPFLSSVKRGSAPRNSLLEWGVDKHKINLVQEATYTSGVSDKIPVDGVDTSSADFEAYDNRAKCATYVQYLRRLPKVSRLANMTSDVAGVGFRKEMSESIAKALVAHKRDLESTLCSSQEANLETGATDPYQTRGLGKWISSSQQSVLPVPNDFLTPSDSIISKAANTFAEEDLRGVMQSIYEQTGETDKVFTGLCGTNVKRVISEFTLFSPRTDNIVTSNRDADNKRLETAIDIIESDFGTIGLKLSSFLQQDARSGGVYDAQAGQNTMFILNMSQLEVAFAEDTSVRELPDLGGGARSLIESVFAQKSYSGGVDHGKITLT